MNRVAPPDTVFHVTTIGRAQQCLAEGIIPGKSSKASKKAAEMDRTFDQARPAHVIELGVSRSDSVFAHPAIDKALERKNGGWLNREIGEMAVLSVYVSGNVRAYVCDGLLNVEPYTAEEYWSSFVSLEDYRAQAEPTFLGPDRYNNCQSRFVYMWPEVLLPGIVPPENIAWDQQVA